MPILYAGVINRSRKVILEGQEKNIAFGFAEIVITNYPHFQRFDRRTMELDDMTQLHYNDQGAWALVVISRKPDVTLYEVTNFMDKLHEALFDQEHGCFHDQSEIQLPNAHQKCVQYGKNLSQFIQKWNAEPKNRDQAYIIFQELVKTKDEMVENLKLILDRGEKLEEGLIKAEQLANSAKTYHKNAKTARRKLVTRRCCCWTVSITTAIVIAVGVFLILWLGSNKSSPEEIAQSQQQQTGLVAKLCCCFKNWQSNDSFNVQIQVLTCDKLSHCLFDFDCVDLNIYEKETYKSDIIQIRDLKSTPEDSSEMITHNMVLFRKENHVFQRDYEYNGYIPSVKDKKGAYVEREEFMRIFFKPDTRTLWGFNHSLISMGSIVNYKDDIDPNYNAEDEENDVDMNNTMWLVLRKTKPTNDTLKKFFAETSSHPIKVKDIIKFGRVNFKVSALSCGKLDDNIQARYEDVTSNTPAVQNSNITQQNLITQNDNNPRNINSHLSLHYTEMPLYENVTFTQNKQQSPDPKFEGKAAVKDADSVSTQRVQCKICLGDEDDEDEPDNEFIMPCKCSGSMKYIHVKCLRSWLNSKKLVYNGDRVKSYFWKALECELCKTPFENQMKTKLFQIMDFERPDEDYLIMESVKSAPAKVIHVFFLDKSNEFKIGRSVETDMKIADISVSRVHSLIKIKNRQLYIEDNGAKFGTLVKIRDPIEIIQGGSPEKAANLFQIGRSLLYFGSSQTKKFNRSNRSLRKIESISSIHYSTPGYLVTKNDKLIPEQFVYKGGSRIVRLSDANNLIQQQFSVSTTPHQGKTTHREEEMIKIEQKHPEQITIPINEDQHQVRVQQQDNHILRGSFGQNSVNAPHEAEISSSIAAQVNSLSQQQIRRSLSPRGMNKINEQFEVQHDRKKSQKIPDPNDLNRFLSNQQSSKVIKVSSLAVNNLDAEISRYKSEKHRMRVPHKAAEITSNEYIKQDSLEDNEAVVQDYEEEEKKVSPNKKKRRMAKVNPNQESSEAYDKFVQGFDEDNHFNFDNPRRTVNEERSPSTIVIGQTRNHKKQLFDQENTHIATTQMSYSKIGGSQVNIQHQRRLQDNRTAADLIEQNDRHVENVSEREEPYGHILQRDGRIDKGQKRKKPRMLQEDESS